MSYRFQNPERQKALRDQIRKNNEGKQGIAYIDNLSERGCICHFEHISFTDEENEIIQELHCIFWQTEKVGLCNRFFLYVSFGSFDIDMDLDTLLGMFIFKYTSDIRIRTLGAKNKKYVPLEEYYKTLSK